MAIIASKLKLNTNCIKYKDSALKEVEDGKIKSQVAAKYGIPKSILPSWIRNNYTIFEATKKETQNASN